MLNGQSIASGSGVLITDIGEGSASALRCMTDQTGCCNVGETRRGQWIFPDGTEVDPPGAGGDFYRDRGTQTVFLHRRNNALGPLGTYCCDVDTVADPDAMICVEISKQGSRGAEEGGG